LTSWSSRIFHLHEELHSTELAAYDILKCLATRTAVKCVMLRIYKRVLAHVRCRWCVRILRKRTLS